MESLITDGKNCKGIISNGDCINCEKILLPRAALANTLKTDDDQVVMSRQITLLSDSILPHEKEQLSFVSIPPSETSEGYAFVQEVGFGAAACPRGMYCLQSTVEGDSDYDPLLKDLRSSKEKRLWSLKFKICDRRVDETSLPGNVFVTQGPEFELDYDGSIERAKFLYQRLYPNEEFLPRAPDPDEIIIGDEHQEEKKDNEDVTAGSQQQENESLEKNIVEKDSMAEDNITSQENKDEKDN